MEFAFGVTSGVAATSSYGLNLWYVHWLGFSVGIGTMTQLLGLR